MAIEQWLVDGQKTIDIGRIRRVKANLIGGSIAVLAHDEPQARVEVASTSVRNLRVAVDGDTLVIDHLQLSLANPVEGAKTLWKGPKADLSLLVPEQCDLDIRTASAEVLVVGVTGDVNVSTASGEQFVDGTSGDLSLNSVDAEVSVRDHRGVVATRTVAGDVTVSGLVSTFTGNTVSGVTVLDITGGLPDRISNRSVAGSTTIRIPAEVTPDYRVTTVTAAATLEGESTQPTRGQTYTSAPSEYAKRLTQVHLQSVAGRVTVVRAAQTDAAGTPAEGGEGRVLVKRPGAKVFRRIVKPDFDQRIDDRVATASDQLGVEAQAADAPRTSDSQAPSGAQPAEPVGDLDAAAPFDASVNDGRSPAAGTARVRGRAESAGRERRERHRGRLERPHRRRGVRHRRAGVRRRGRRLGGGRGALVTPPVFAHGHLRLYLLALLNEQPRHGYELIQALSDRFDGTYAPSAGTIYPRLAKLEEEGLVTKEVDGRKTIYRITEAGRREVEARADELDEIEQGVDTSVQRLARELRESLGEARDRLRTEFNDLRARSSGPDGATWSSDFGQMATEFAQRASEAAGAGWTAFEQRRAAGGEFGDQVSDGFKAAKHHFVPEHEASAPHDGDRDHDRDREPRPQDTPQAPEADAAPGMPGAAGTAGDPAGDSRIARRADLSLDRFRQDLRQDLRRAEAAGRVNEEIVGLLDAELTRVRDLVRSALAPRT